MKGYGIEIKNNLLEPKHVKAMGSSLWEYLWVLDHVTKIDDDGVGYVHGDAPIKLKLIQEDLGIAKENISRNLTKLVNEGYINTVRTPYGIKISVNKAFKRFNKNVNKELTKSQQDLTNSSNVIKTITIDNNNKTNTPTPLKSNPYRSTTYLTNIPLEDLTKFSETYNATKSQIQQIAEEILLYHESTGKKYANYRATLQSWTLRKYGKRTNGGYTRI